jgi:hypothetical protein
VAVAAHDADKLRELDDGTRRAWMAYRDRLRGLDADEYERVEATSWAELQTELRRLDRRRQTLNRTSA